MAISPAMTPMQDMPPLNGGPPIDVEIMPDGTPPLDYEEELPPEAPAHRANLAEFLDDSQLRKIAADLIEQVDADNLTRSDWIETYSKGLDYLGFKFEDRTEPFKGACGVYHPVLAEAVVRFQSNAIMEIFPASGPALTRIIGDDTPDKVAQAKRVKEELNYLTTEKMKEYRNETEMLLFRLPLAGSVFRKVWYDPLKKRPSACMVPAEDLIIDYGCSDLENSERYTHLLKKSQNEVRKLQRVGFYRKVKLQKPQHEPPPTGKEKEDEITGIEPLPQVDNRHHIYEVHVSYNLPGPFEDPDEIADPYIISIDKTSQTVLSIYRNWAEGDEPNRVMEQYFVHYQYMPGLGFYGIGLIHLIGSMAKAATSILRQLVDAGTFANFPGGLKTRGLRTKGDDTPVMPGEWRDVDVPAGTIAQNLFPMPYKEPSAVLAALLASLVEEARRVGSIADVEFGATSQNIPVGTMMAMLERSLKVMSAVHARLHASQRRELGLISKSVHDYMDEKYEWDPEGKFNRREDFFPGTVDVIPVSDPNASTQAQKVVQMQAVQQQAALNPELYNMKELHRAGLDAIGIKNTERILPMDQPPPRLDPVQENMAILTSQPIKVYPDQDHTAHIQVHLSMITDPKILEMLKASPSAAKMQGQMEAHMAEHLAHQYRGEIEQMMGTQLPPLGEEMPPEVEGMISRALADASVRLRELHEKQAQDKVNQQLAADPVYALREREVAVKERKQQFEEQKTAVDRTIEVAEEVADRQFDYAELQSRERQAAAKIGADLITFGLDADTAERREGIQLGKEIAESISTDIKDEVKQARDADEKAKDRQHDSIEKARDRVGKIQEARVKAAARPKPNGSK